MSTPSKSHSYPSLRTPEHIKNYYKLLAQQIELVNRSRLLGEPLSNKAKGMTQDGRAELCTQFGVPWNPKQEPKPGHLFVCYPQADNFVNFLMQQSSFIFHTLTGQEAASVSAQPNDEGQWQGSRLYEFLKDLTTDEALAEEFYKTFPDGTPEDKEQFWEKHLPENHYQEQQAIEEVMAQQTAKPRLSQSTSELFWSLENTAFW